MDKIGIRGLNVYAHHGVYPEENEKGQNFIIHADLYMDLDRAGSSDDLADTVNYGEACRFINSRFKERTCKLLEHAGQDLAEALLLRFTGVRFLTLRVEKPNAPIPLPVETVSVTLERGWNRAYIGLGANLGKPKAQILSAIEQMEQEPKIRVCKTSQLIITKAYGKEDQPDFLNGVCEVETLFSPEELLEFLLAEEVRQGRKREEHWGPRTLDLDLLFYESRKEEGYTHQIRNTEFLRLPHYDLHNREFVLKPLDELRPDLIHPIYGKSIRVLLEELEKRG